MIWVSLLFALSLFAVPIGNPSSPFVLDEGFSIPDTTWSNVQGGVCVDYLINKRLHSPSSHQSSLSGTSETCNFIWSIRDRLNIQADLGTGQFNWRYNRFGGAITGESRGGLLWSGSGKYILFQAKDTMVALSGSAGGWDWMNGPIFLDDHPLSHKAPSYLRYWQAALGVTQQISIFFPYIGVAWNRTRLHIAPASLKPTTLHAWHGMGPFGGCTLSSGNRFLLNMEWRGWFEEGASLSFQFRF